MDLEFLTTVKAFAVFSQRDAKTLCRCKSCSLSGKEVIKPHFLKRTKKTSRLFKKSVHQEKCKYKHLAFDLNLYMEEFIYWAKSSNSGWNTASWPPTAECRVCSQKDA